MCRAVCIHSFLPDPALAFFFQGDAPSGGYNTLADTDMRAVVYYLPGTTNWGATYGGRPTALWNPLAQTRDANFGVRTGRFGFNITGTTNIPIVVEASTSIISPNWVTVQNYSLTNGLIYFSDSQWTSHLTHFYRIRSP